MTSNTSLSNTSEADIPHFQALLIQEGASELADLIDQRKEGWKDDSLNKYFAYRLPKINPAGALAWFNRMKLQLMEIDAQTACVPARGKLDFLDLGLIGVRSCSPGGFSSYVLERNGRARGLERRQCFLLEEHLRRRYEFISADIADYQLGPALFESSFLQPLPEGFDDGVFDLCFLDAVPVWQEQKIKGWDSQRLFISQFILALKGVKRGGTIVIRLSRPELLYTARILWILDRVSQQLHTCKPLTIHAKRPSFYAVAVGVGLGVEASRLPAIVDQFQRLWVELTFGGEEGEGRWLEDVDLNFLISQDDLIDTFADRLIDLSRSVWVVQTQTLSKLVSASKKQPPHEMWRRTSSVLTCNSSRGHT
ncbi:hypothetical protein K443DRAFT_134091 [Laccaria amethystina LaAM-08-1]|uniref:Ribosomal RNA methyltransferase FtsJ domain-containing protein n=1 Tax=Laccaria amethystina LaAM-08-1 TaxID=1095629 RepID=A0A0C9X5N3_9AGAR|nr:hypothetical protein K443DRAFT_134091 [Laccaria amethystina LaAM-08-1]